MRVRVKICGISTQEVAVAACREGADAIGFVFAESPRHVSVEHATALARKIPPFIARVAVLRNPDAAHAMHIVSAFNPDILQSEPTPGALEAVSKTRISFLPVLHDDETLEAQFAALHDGDVPFSAIILEGPGRGGRGVIPDWDRAAGLAGRVPLVLAGGLRPDNVAAAVRHVRPFAVDVSSGVEEAPGVKSPRLIADFMVALRAVERTPERGAV